MKRLISLFLCVLFTFSLCACQQAAPSSSEAPDQQAITEEATEYFNQMMDGDFETFFNALPQGVQDNTSAEAVSGWTMTAHGRPAARVRSIIPFRNMSTTVYILYG